MCCIASDHTPVDIEDKKCEFDRAAFGTVGLQTAFGASWAALSDTVSIEKMVELLSVNPRRRFGVEVPTIDTGKKAEITLFEPQSEWIFTKDMIESKAKNSAFIGQKMKGVVIAVCNKGGLFV